MSNLQPELVEIGFTNTPISSGEGTVQPPTALYFRNRSGQNQRIELTGVTDAVLHAISGLVHQNPTVSLTEGKAAFCLAPTPSSSNDLGPYDIDCDGASGSITLQVGPLENDFTIVDLLADDAGIDFEIYRIGDMVEGRTFQNTESGVDDLIDHARNHGLEVLIDNDTMVISNNVAVDTHIKIYILDPDKFTLGAQNGNVVHNSSDSQLVFCLAGAEG